MLVLKRLSPDEAWEQFFTPDYLPTKFTPELEYLLTEHVEEVKVTINVIRLPFGKGVQYKCAELARYTGENVKVSLPVLEWSKTGLPDKMIVIAGAGKHHFTAYRETAVNPAMWLLDPDCDDLRKAKRENAGMEAPMKELYKKLNPRFNTLPPVKPLRTRQTVGDSEAHEKGRALADSRSKTNLTDRKRDMGGRLAGVLSGMDATEEKHLVEHGRNLETARSRAVQREKEERQRREDEAKFDRAARTAELDAQEAELKHLFD